jgi:hypothetical protein
MNVKPSNIDEVLFETRDTEIFKIPDLKTRIATVQNYFFPRLEFLLRQTLEFVQTVYDVNPYERMTFVYRPSNRKNAKRNLDFYEAHVGISGKRTDGPLTIKHKNGKPYFFHPMHLTYNVSPEGYIRVVLRPFIFYVNQFFVESVAKLVQENMIALTPVLALPHISYTGAGNFVTLERSLVFDESGCFDTELFSPVYYFPVDINRGLVDLIIAFVALYPLADSIISIGKGEAPRLFELLQKFKDWWLSSEVLEDDTAVSIAASTEAQEMLDLDSYHFVRAGLWWNVLARDNWTCCSCGRTAKDGITLEVDHIVPRSWGGTDDIGNLQTLCRKCNIGKSNKDSTNLRE